MYSEESTRMLPLFYVTEIQAKEQENYCVLTVSKSDLCRHNEWTDSVTVTIKKFSLPPRLPFLLKPLIH